MIHIIYSFAYFIIRFSGLAYIFRYFFAKKGVTITMSHNPDAETFDKHLNYLTKKYNIISLPELQNAIENRDFKNIPDYALVLTFDDGWKENYHLITSFKHYNVRPTIYLTSHIVNTNRYFWWTMCVNGEAEELKYLPDSERLERLKEQYHHYPEKEYKNGRQALNNNEIKELQKYVDFGLHTRFHPILTKCTSDQKNKEIIEGKLKLESMLNSSIETFAYPNGEYDEECINILKNSGIKLARTTDAGWNNKNSKLHELKITGVSDNASKSKLIAELTGIPLFFQYFFQGSFNGKKVKF